ncbi:TetR/AcrR family transcriptional regulator [Streptomyces sp. SID13031]|uniref:TetR/AcrR family transcriptional regulator C-terminal ligand-binding domain-containing protein n=1 Tax=Streptomyces sp. SID13031 TaxID=2706046 RepID=UPI0013C63DCB|nr:TetR/AcrR family transcriptional regulator [Streptomyces sp. SID13031]
MSQTGATRGRPPDPDIELRVLEATLELYGEVGWARLNLDIVARRAKVGKAALYRRWPTKEDLMAAVFAARAPSPQSLDTGALRGDLLAVAIDMIERLFSPDGLAFMRAHVEAKIYPELIGNSVEKLRREQTDIGRQIVLRGIDRGELPAGTSPALILDAISGTIQHHFLATPNDRLAEFEAESHQYAERVVDFILAAAKYRPVVGPAS